MLSLLIFCEGSEAVAAPKLVRALSALVPGVVRGLMADVHLLTPASEVYEAIAAEAGLHHLTDEADGFGRSLGALKGPWCLALAGDQRADGALFDALEAFIAGPQRAALLRSAPQNLAQRLLPTLAPVSGLLWHRAQLAAAVPSSWSALRAALRPRQTLPARTHPL